jgi:hypothetical protein
MACEIQKAIKNGVTFGEYLFAPAPDGCWYLFGPSPWDENPVLAELPPHPAESRAAIVAAYEAGFGGGRYYEEKNAPFYFIRNMSDLGAERIAFYAYKADELDDAMSHADNYGGYVVDVEGRTV